MRKVTIELDLSEAVKLMAICNHAIISEEETLRSLVNGKCTKNIIDNTRISIDLIWKIKDKIKKVILNEGE